MLFILAIDPLAKIIDHAIQEDIISLIPSRAIRMRTSLYADDAAIFMNPIKTEIQAFQQILQVFGQATGLVTNLQKSALYPIRCGELDLQEILQPFPGECNEFPCKYLGLLLHTRKLRKIHVLPTIDKIASRLPSWKGKLLSKAGRLTLINSVLSSLLTYHLTIFPLAPHHLPLSKVGTEEVRQN